MRRYRENSGRVFGAEEGEFRCNVATMAIKDQQPMMVDCEGLIMLIENLF